MKTQIRILVAIAMISSAACSKKEEEPTPVIPQASNTDNYSSMNDFFIQNGVPMQNFTVDAVAGGAFTTPQGTQVTVRGNAFVTQAGGAVTGNVTIQFKDIYKKSDMLLSDRGTRLNNGSLLVSAGEFFIKALFNNAAVLLAPGKKIEVVQPQDEAMTDTVMMPFFGVIDSVAMPAQPLAFNWVAAPVNNTVNVYDASAYVFSLYQFGGSVGGTWCNSDNGWFFNAYPQTTLTLHGTDNVADFETDVFLIFKNIKTMTHVYRSTLSDFPFAGAPSGLECTVVAVGVKNGKLFSSFKPITITTNLTVDFTLSETTTQAFKTQLEALN